MASSNIAMLGKTGNSAASDECYTPDEAVAPLLPYLERGKVWYEATSGRSQSIVNFLNSNGHLCAGSSGDFFGDVDCLDGIITNPPYSKKDKFLEKCYATGKPFALLLPVSSLQGQKRGAMFSKCGVDILVLNRRIDFTGNGAPHFGVAWFTRGILPQPLIFADVETANG